MSTQQPPNTTTDAGMPVSSDDYSLTVGPGGPVLLQDTYLNREASPLRPRARPRSRGTMSRAAAPSAISR